MIVYIVHERDKFAAITAFKTYEDAKEFINNDNYGELLEIDEVEVI
jgi:hypothetical protein